MAKKAQDKSGIFLTPAQYYKWQYEAEKFYKQEIKAKLVETQMQVIQLQTQNAKLKESLYAEQVGKSAKALNAAKSEFDKYLADLTKEVGVDLKSRSVNPVTLELVEL